MRLLSVALLALAVCGVVLSQSASQQPNSAGHEESNIERQPQQLRDGESQSPTGLNLPLNVIILIGDGMGYEHIRSTCLYTGRKNCSMCAAAIATHAKKNGLAIPEPSLPSHPSLHFPMHTRSWDSDVTDSAAGATAFSTGRRVNNSNIAWYNEPIPTILENAKQVGMRTGIVTTAVLPHATPGAFSAHVARRTQLAEIAQQQLQSTRPNLLLGGGGMRREDAELAGYWWLEDAEMVEALRQGEGNGTDAHVVGSFAGKDGPFFDKHMPYEYDGYRGENASFPHLDQLAAASLRFLSRPLSDANEDNGFFLMIEGGRIDHAAHYWMTERLIFETWHFLNVTDAVREWAMARNDTLVIITADHETGGVHIPQPVVQGEFPRIVYFTNWHTGVDVGLWAYGPGSELFSAIAANKSGSVDNTDVFKALSQAVSASSLRQRQRALDAAAFLRIDAGSITVSDTTLIAGAVIAAGVLLFVCGCCVRKAWSSPAGARGSEKLQKAVERFKNRGIGPVFGKESRKLPFGRKYAKVGGKKDVTVVDEEATLGTCEGFAVEDENDDVVLLDTRSRLPEAESEPGAFTIGEEEEE